MQGTRSQHRLQDSAVLGEYNPPPPAGVANGTFRSLAVGGRYSRRAKTRDGEVVDSHEPTAVMINYDQMMLVMGAQQRSLAILPLAATVTSF